MMKPFHWFKRRLDDYITSNTSRIDKTSFTEPDTTEATSTLLLLTRDPGLADIDRFMIKKISKTGNTDLIFLDQDKHWQSLTNKRTGKFLVAEAIRIDLVD